MTKEPPPSELRTPANGLEHRVLEWPASRADAPIVLLLHGFLDAAGTWDRVAPAIARHGFRVLAPDMRGFGNGPRTPAGSYYHFTDYVADIAALVEHLSPSAPVSVVGHSMGGTIATLYAGTFPEKVVRLANLEGVGPPDNTFDVGPIRMRRWISDLRALSARTEPPPLMTHDEARRRLSANHSNVAPEILEHRLPHLVHEVTAPDGSPRVKWRFDPLHRTTAPSPFFARLFIEFAKRVECPVLFVSGGPTGFHPPDEAERVAAFSHVARATVEGAGHMMHWTRPEALAALLDGFLLAPPSPLP